MKSKNILKQSVVAAFFIVAISLAGCDKTPEDIPGITIDDAALNQTAFADQTAITGGVTFTTAGAWTATVAKAEAGEVTWLTIDPSSGDAGTHTINITLEPNTTGEERAATITVTSGGMSIKIGITQAATKTDGTTPVTGVTMSETVLTLEAGETATLTATVAPDDAGDKTITWTSSDETVATVVDGVVTAMDKGMAVIIATTKDGGKTATCTVTVNKPVISMTIAMEGEFDIFIAGTGTAVINWGDDSEPKEVTLLAPDDFSGLTDEHAYTHTFTGTSARNITIDGQNIAITYLTCHEGGLTHLDVSNNPALENLGCAANQLTSLDLSKNTALITLFCSVNQITSLDMSNNPALFDLSCPNNQLTSLDVSKSAGLYQVACDNNKLTSLDVSSSLSILTCSGNQLTSLDVSRCFWLTNLACSGNQLTSLDISNNTALHYLDCSNNGLEAGGLDALFHTLPGNPASKHIFVLNNPGTATCNQSIATAKGWTVFATNNQ